MTAASPSACSRPPAATAHAGPGRARAVAAGGLEQAEGEAAVMGVVVSPELGPLASGRIDLWCRDGELAARVAVGEDGSFSGPACPGTTCVRLVHPAFEQPRGWELEPDEARELTVVHAAQVRGTVLSTAGDAIADASLIVHDADGRRVAARSDAGGEFRAAIPGLRPCDACDLERGTPTCRADPRPASTSRGRVLVSASDYAPVEVEVELEIGAEIPLELVLPPPAAPITGRVLGLDGRPFGARAMALATNVAREAEQHACAVDESGSFVLSGLGDGRYRLRVVRDGRELATADDVAPGDEIELRAEVPARGVTLGIKVTAADDRPMAKVRVDGGPFRGAWTDDEGYVAAASVLPGRYTLRLRAAKCPVVREIVDVAAPGMVTPRIVRLPPGC
ncbi:hypothetical protein ENSA5_31460 [Enhygromyxa salina]|uniref:Carboxypeptidase regulatory-like domain-containing protein n=2 Tax=Enhygromyxa salina TaxID=215803 RepID=A0A2S9XY17_9BACT|nr:hypothetical protein ENSA5_31460 [Enhygromyxa salina]